MAVFLYEVSEPRVVAECNTEWRLNREGNLPTKLRLPMAVADLQA